MTKKNNKLIDIQGKKIVDLKKFLNLNKCFR